MATMQLNPENVEFLEHFGVKGMRWGVRRYKSKASRAGAVTRNVGRALVVGDSKKSLATSRGRKSFKSNVKKDVARGKKKVNALLDNKAFKTFIYNHENAKKIGAMNRQTVQDAVKLLGG